MKNGRFSKQSFLAISILLLSTGLTFARTITVGIENSARLESANLSIQSSIDAAEEGDIIIVSEGLYVGPINFKGKNIILTSTDPNNWDVVKNTSILSSHDSSNVTFNGQENENCILQGFTICTGGANYGAGINGNGSKATIRKCYIRDNYSKANGGGLYDCDGLIDDCIISNNSALCPNSIAYGGGLYDCDGTIKNCIISGNTAGNLSLPSLKGEGGGLSNCHGKIIGCTIKGNSVLGSGGGLSECNSVTNCIISGNTATMGNGGGIYNCNEIINCTIVGNYSNTNGGAIYFKCENGIVENTIIWDNLAINGGQVGAASNTLSTSVCNLSVDYSDVQGGRNSFNLSRGAVLRWESNNLDTYPLFKQPGSWTTAHKWNEGDYHLLNNSVCIDAGDPNGNYADQNDIDGGRRLFGQYVDIGADESVYVPPVFVQLEITGPTQVNESNEAQYGAIGRYNDNSQTNLTKEATWSVEPAGIGTIDANGLFKVGDLNESKEVTIKASYTPEGQQTLYIAQMTVLCVKVPEPVVTYYVDTATGNDQNSGLSRQSAFKTIQAGIDASEDGDTVLVYPGIYRECVIFWGKIITLRSAEGAAVIENPNGIAVLFCYGETGQCTIQNFIIRNSQIGILNILNSSPTIKNLTIVNNNYGIQCYESSPDISNCIFWSNTSHDFVNCIPKYSCIEKDMIIITIFTGNIYTNPLFADPNAGDYHLKSERGRYWPLYDIWVLDDVTSPCIDAGNPADDFTKERQPNGGRINMGAYGNTSQASMSMLTDELYKAYYPNPGNGAINISLRPTLIWTAGVNAILHDVYFGTNLDNVRNATRETPLGILVSQGKSSTSYLVPSNLVYNTMYFWRIDEIDASGTITKGDIWAFVTLEGGKQRGACFVGQVPVWLDGKPVEISKAAAGQNAAITGPRYKVVTIQEHDGTYDLLDIELESGRIITVADQHYFLTDSGQWLSSKKLEAGMKLKTAKGTIAIKSITKQSKPFTGKVYNLDIKGADRYMVGQDAVIVRDY